MGYKTIHKDNKLEIQILTAGLLPGYERFLLQQKIIVHISIITYTEGLLGDSAGLLQMSKTYPVGFPRLTKVQLICARKF